jgi:hypothetical protein
MTERKPKRGFVSRPGAAETRITSPATSSALPPNGAAFTAGLPIDGPPEWPSRITLAALQHGITVADRLRLMPARPFLENEAAS